MSDGGFMGAMFGAQIVADEVAYQGRMNRRQINHLHNQAAELAALRINYDALSRSHNTLTNDYQVLRRWATDLANRFNQRAEEMDRLLQANKELTAENQRLQKENHELVVENDFLSLCKLELIMSSGVRRTKDGVVK